MTIKNCFAIVLLTLSIISCAHTEQRKELSKTHDFYMSPCIFLKGTTCPPDLFSKIDSAEIKGNQSNKIVKVALDDFDLFIDYTVIKNKTDEVKSFYPSKEFNSFYNEIYSLDIKDNQPKLVDGMLHTNIVNYLSALILEKGECKIVNKKNNAVVKTINIFPLSGKRGKATMKGKVFMTVNNDIVLQLITSLSK